MQCSRRNVAKAVRAYVGGRLIRFSTSAECFPGKKASCLFENFCHLKAIISMTFICAFSGIEKCKLDFSFMLKHIWVSGQIFPLMIFTILN